MRVRFIRSFAASSRSRYLFSISACDSLSVTSPRAASCTQSSFTRPSYRDSPRRNRRELVHFREQVLKRESALGYDRFHAELAQPIEPLAVEDSRHGDDRKVR